MKKTTPTAAPVKRNQYDERPGPALAIKYVALAVLVAFAIGVVIGVVLRAKFAPCVVVPTLSIQRDTIIKRDTVRGVIRPPVVRTIIRRDTLKLQSKPADTAYTDTTK